MINYIDKTVFLGIDVHKRTYSVTAICEGIMVKQDTFLASPEIFVKYCRRAFQGAKIKSAYEAGFCGFGLHRFLVNNGIDNIVVHPANIEVESRNRKKTDKRDSKKIAIQLAAGRLQGVYVPTPSQENRRCISRLREIYVKQRTRTAIQLKSFLNVNNLISADKSPKISIKYLNELFTLDLDDNLQFYIKKLAKTWLYFTQEIKEIEKRLFILTQEEQSLYEAYRKISGFGPRISRILMHELGSTMQFSNEEKLFSFCGLTPSEHSSGEHKRLGHITRQGNPTLRKVLVQAAWVAVKKDPYFSEYYEDLRIRKGACRAIIAVARKLIGRARCAIKKKELYFAEKAKHKVVLQEDFVAASSWVSVDHECMKPRSSV
jgi:transposase